LEPFSSSRAQEVGQKVGEAAAGGRRRARGHGALHKRLIERVAPAAVRFGPRTAVRTPALENRRHRRGKFVPWRKSERSSGERARGAHDIDPSVALCAVHPGASGMRADCGAFDSSTSSELYEPTGICAQAGEPLAARAPPVLGSCTQAPGGIFSKGFMKGRDVSSRRSSHSRRRRCLRSSPGGGNRAARFQLCEQFGEDAPRLRFLDSGDDRCARAWTRRRRARRPADAPLLEPR